MGVLGLVVSAAQAQTKRKARPATRAPVTATRKAAAPQAATALSGLKLTAAVALKLNPSETTATAFSEGKTFIAGSKFVSQVDDEGGVRERILIGLNRVSGLSRYKAGKLLLADPDGAALHQLDLETKNTQLLVKLSDIAVTGVENGTLLRMGELSGVASDGSDIVFVSTEAGYSSSIFKIDLKTRKVLQQQFAPGPSPSSLQLEGANLFVVDRTSAMLRRFDTLLRLSMDSVKVPVVGARAVLVKGDEVRAVTLGQAKMVIQKANLAPLRAPWKAVTMVPIRRITIPLVPINLSKKYAVLICGDVAESGFDSFWNDTVWMYKTLKAKGYAPADIFVLYGYGNDFVSANPFYKVPEKVTDFAATPANVNMVLDGLKNGDAAHGIPKMDSNDTLFMWLFDHGGRTAGGEATLALRGGSLTASAFAAKANPIAYAKRAVFAQQCFSGGFIGPLANAKTYVSTAARATEVAHVANTEKEVVGGKTYTHGEYNYYLIGALSGKYPNNASANADTITANGKVSAKEAHSWVVAKEDQSEIPQQSDPGGIGNGFYLN